MLPTTNENFHHMLHGILCRISGVRGRQYLSTLLRFSGRTLASSYSEHVLIAKGGIHH